MTKPEPLHWSEPATRHFATIRADDWRIVPIPRDVCRIHYSGSDADGTIVDAMEAQGYAESVAEAKIVVDVLRAGTGHLPDWRQQLEAAGFVRTYPDAAPTSTLSRLWHDRRPSGRFSVDVADAFVHDCGTVSTSVHAIYESGRANFWHNVCRIDAGQNRTRAYGEVRLRDGLPEGVDALKAGVAAAIAIRAARRARGGRFATPLGGATRPL